MSEAANDLSGAKRRIIERLKRADTSTAPELAAEFGLTDTAIRQHLEALEGAELVERVVAPSSGRGRPPVHWRLAASASSLFADRHSDLTVELIASIRSALGEEALEAVVRTRAERQLANYRGVLDGATNMSERVHRIAELRSAEGYLAEAVEGDGHITLVEHHCPIQGAADSCAGLCSAELDLFQKALGPDVTVAREQHLLDGGQRCSYRVTLR
ncbi:MAG: helix-turn-helix domain-containing protein [Ilumatobacteraceae bacterium]|jgi:predicted ArsR family transcriptional regulator|nr:helix-turn-helix domain-containing protein [Acidimicrobiaceae bacterium]MBP6488948.1 helix-turn-helix domain-containing protein [Ilumatobacteraceae bacterium]MBK9972287.1 helix-turn-helix domain-containing protein [Acidimicrobiaceae bacterium]MBP7889341.1 helix-turn-helix domain-containing protein [Ilumatobacteraceae bacterium]MBP8209748.1 helix-turn-helix domain-containing protein [Ilumatobacteraceae bacterium]